jgi:hypothetical protein
LTYRFEEEISKFGLEFANKLSVANVSMTVPGQPYEFPPKREDFYESASDTSLEDQEDQEDQDPFRSSCPLSIHLGYLEMEEDQEPEPKPEPASELLIRSCIIVE